MARPKSSLETSDGTLSPTPKSDPDPFSMTAISRTFEAASSTSLPPHIDPSSLPGGFPFLRAFTGYTHGYRTRLINSRLSDIKTVINRPLTVPEEQAVAWHTAKAFGISSWGAPIGITAGMWRWWKTMDEMRWPWLGKMRDENENRAWQKYREGSGPKPPAGVRYDAGRLWVGDRELMKAWDPVRKEVVLQGVRAQPYIALGWAMAAVIIGGYAATVTVVGELKDERLRNLEKELKERFQKTRSERQGEVQGGAGGVGSEPTGQGNAKPTETWKKRREAIEKGYEAVEQDDDASPTSGDDFFGETEGEVRSRTTDNSNAKPQRQGGFQKTAQVDPFQTSDRQSGFQQDRYEKQTQVSNNSFDDASPTGGTGAVGNDDKGANGSVWERIRQDATSGPPSSPSPAGEKRIQRGGFPQPQPRPQQGKKEEDGFAFSSSEEEKAYAKDEAQKDFDARVEKEREGGDFDGGRKW